MAIDNLRHLLIMVMDKKMMLSHFVEINAAVRQIFPACHALKGRILFTIHNRHVRRQPPAGFLILKLPQDLIIFSDRL